MDKKCPFMKPSPLKISSFSESRGSTELGSLSLNVYEFPQDIYCAPSQEYCPQPPKPAIRMGGCCLVGLEEWPAETKSFS